MIFFDKNRDVHLNTRAVLNARAIFYNCYNQLIFCCDLIQILDWAHNSKIFIQKGLCDSRLLKLYLCRWKCWTALISNKITFTLHVFSFASVWHGLEDSHMFQITCFMPNFIDQVSHHHYLIFNVILIFHQLMFILSF